MTGSDGRCCGLNFVQMSAFAKVDAGSTAGGRGDCSWRKPRTTKYWVAVKELKLSYHNGYIW